MKKMRLVFVTVLALLVSVFSMTALAAPSYENPFDGMYTEQATAARTPGTAKIFFTLLDTNRAPLKGAILVYNSTQGRDLRAVADENGVIKMELKNSELIYVRHVLLDGHLYPISGEDLINDISVQDVHRGAVRWNVLHRYSYRAFMAYNAAN